MRFNPFKSLHDCYKKAANKDDFKSPSERLEAWNKNVSANKHANAQSPYSGSYLVKLDHSFDRKEICENLEDNKKYE